MLRWGESRVATHLAAPGRSRLPHRRKDRSAEIGPGRSLTDRAPAASLEGNRSLRPTRWVKYWHSEVHTRSNNMQQCMVELAHMSHRMSVSKNTEAPWASQTRATTLSIDT